MSNLSDVPGILEASIHTIPVDIQVQDPQNDGEVTSLAYGTYVARQMANIKGGYEPNLMHAVIGIGSEAGELLDAVKKNFAYGKALDQENLLEEAGDLLFYFTALCLVQGWTLEQVAAANMNKLMKRYPDGVFNTLHAIQRLDKQAEAGEVQHERNMLQSGSY